MNGHVATIKNNNEFDSAYAKSTLGGYILGGRINVPESIGVEWRKLKNKCSCDDAPLVQSLVFSDSEWTPDKAKAWLGDNNIKYRDFKPICNMHVEATESFIRPPFLSGQLDDFIKGNIDAPPEWIQILPRVNYTHPERGEVVITNQVLLMMKSNFEKLNGDYIVIDYEHSGIRAIIAVGAGWITQLEIREGDSGLWAKVLWTPNAAQRIIDKEYRYGSPVFGIEKDEDGIVTDAILHSHAITNVPVIKGMDPLFNSMIYFNGETKMAKECVTIENSKFCKVDNKYINGDNLASLLNEQIDSKVNDNTTRGDVVEDVAGAGGISSGTLNQILAGSINCPPLNRLEGFARELGISVDRLRRAAERDGCEYDTETENKKSIANTKSEDDMIEELRTLYGLQCDASDKEILQCANKDRGIAEQMKDLKKEREQLLNSHKTILATLGVEDEGGQQNSDDAITKTLATNFVNKIEFEKLNAEFAGYKKGVEAEKRDRLINSAMEAGKILPAQKEWATKLGETDIESLEQYINTAKPAIPVNQRIVNGVAKTDAAGLGNNQEKLNKLAQEYAEQNKCDYKQALRYVCSQNKELTHGILD